LKQHVIVTIHISCSNVVVLIEIPSGKSEEGGQREGIVVEEVDVEKRVCFGGGADVVPVHWAPMATREKEEAGMVIEASRNRKCEESQKRTMKCSISEASSRISIETKQEKHLRHERCTVP
jgi:hypothetical protein